eukprot:m.236512 g.236512  ORF g.236512 m.236512 type:complete len:61 (+) comp40134_c0_seq1:212-394(+)
MNVGVVTNAAGCVAPWITCERLAQNDSFFDERAEVGVLLDSKCRSFRAEFGCVRNIPDSR